MIGKISYGRYFGGLRRYLVDKDKERVADVDVVNTQSFVPEEVSAEMQERVREYLEDNTAHLKKPVLHMSVSFHPEDPVDTEKMKDVMRDTLKEMGLEDHQAMMVVHQDRNHPHIHAMVNRVNYYDDKVFQRDWDYDRLHDVMRSMEQKYDLRKVRHPREVAESSLRIGEQKQGERITQIIEEYGLKDDEDPVLLRAQSLRSDLVKAESFAEFDKILAKEDLYIDRKGAGSVITDGIHQVKSSRVSRDFGISKLETKFGEDFGAYIKERNEVTKDLSKVLDEAGVKDFMDQSRQERSLLNLVERRNELEREYASVRNYRTRYEELGASVDKSIASAFTNNEEVFKNIREGVRKEGMDATLEKFGNSPGKFGDLKADKSITEIEAHLKTAKHNWIEIQQLRERSPQYARMSTKELRNLESKLTIDLAKANDRIDQFKEQNPDISLNSAKRSMVNTLQKAIRENGLDEVQAKSHLNRAGMEALSIGKSLSKMSVNPGGVAKKVLRKVLKQALEQTRSRGMGI